MDKYIRKAHRASVVALGAEAASVAALYARLTGRHWRIAPDSAALARLNGCKVIVALAERIDDELLERIYVPGRRVCPGLIVGATLADLRRRALACASAATSEPSSLPDRVEVMPGLDFGVVRGAHHTLLGRHATADDIRTALGRGDTAVMIHGHGDGIDGDLGALVLCPVDRAWRRGDAEHAPVCKSTGLCHRRDIAIASRAHAAARLHPAEIAARVLLWNTCIGYPSPRGFIHPRWGVGSRLAASTSLGAFVTTWRIAIMPPALSAALMDDMMTGEPLGRAIARYNASRAARRLGNRLCLFGDPDTRIAPPVPDRRRRPLALKSETCKRSAREIRAAGEPAQVSFIATCLAGEAAGHTVTRDRARELVLRDKAREALDAIRAGAQPDDNLRAAFGAYAAHRATIRDLWLPSAVKLETSGESACPHCGSQTLCYRALVAGNARPRALIICNRCEVIADRPERHDIAATISHAGIELRGDELDCPAWAGAVKVGSRWPVPPRQWSWPADETGRAARFMPFHDASWDYPAEVAVVMMFGLEICVLSRTLRALVTS
ncbi:MAG: hypothetical protein ACK4UO_05700 [Pseudolabrys sp.]